MGDHDDSGQTESQKARGIPTKDGLMDPGIDTTMGGSKTTVNPPAGLESEIEGAGVRGAADDGLDTPKGDEKARSIAREGVAKAFDPKR